ncbi:MAG: hypothetical protein SGJ20_03105, partial [Planctomycetota bacterium]|nr:hypothetical protein [Planctomycetota bacterium]
FRAGAAMNDDHNPYQSPHVASSAGLVVPRFSLPVMILWLVIVAVNLPLPISLGWILTEEHGRVAMFTTMFCILCVGWFLCYRRPRLAHRLITGGIIVACFQLFPIPLFIIGIGAQILVFALGLGKPPDHPESMHRISSELEGVVFTVFVAAMLCAFAYVVGSNSSWIFPERWFQSEEQEQKTA